MIIIISIIILFEEHETSEVSARTVFTARDSVVVVTTVRP